MMQAITVTDVEKCLQVYLDPDLSCDLFKAKAIKNIDISENTIQLEIVLGYPIKTVREARQKALKDFLQSSFPTALINIKFYSQIETHVGQANIKALPQIKNIVAVASGKGGVGKSTIAANLALALAQEGALVGILDADIYGPSQPTLLGIQTRPEVRDKKIIMPIKTQGIEVMSIGLLMDEAAAVVWRGPMISMALQQLLNDTQWGTLDYLIIDLPPGTGDIQLTLAQKIPLSGALMVTTPQEVALKDVKRACAMFEKLNIPILGLVENMTAHTCSHCGHVEALFGQGGGEHLAQAFKIPLLAQFSLDRQIQEESDRGLPLVAKNPEGHYAEQCRKLARRLTARLSLQAKSYSHRFPAIKVE